MSFPPLNSYVRILAGQYTGYWGKVVAIDESEYSCLTVYPNGTEVNILCTPEEVSL